MTSLITKYCRFGLVGALLPLLLLTVEADADVRATAWIGGDEASVRLIADAEGMDDKGRIWLGLHIRLGPGWKTFWRNPGEAGVPPQFDWQESENIQTAEVRWPAPHRFTSYGFDNFGYQDEVVLPVRLQASSETQATVARLNLAYMICQRICVPMQAKLALNLPAAGAAPVNSPERELIGQYLALVPSTDGKTMKINGATVNGRAGKQTLQVVASTDKPFREPDLMVEAPEPFSFGRPEVSFRDDGRMATLVLPVFGGSAKRELKDETLTLTLVDGARATERRISLGD